MTADLTLLPFWLIALGSLYGGIRYLAQHEAAKRRAAKIVFPPPTVVAQTINDEIPF